MLAWWFVLGGCSTTLSASSTWGPLPWDTGTSACAAYVVSQGPEGDAVNRHRRIAIDLPPEHLPQAEDVSVQVERDTSGGWEDVEGELHVREGDLVRIEFVPSVPLPPLTTHSVLASTPDCGTVAAFEFTTSEVGLPVDRPYDAIGLPFLGNAANASLTTPDSLVLGLEPTGAVQFVIEDFDLPRNGITMSASRQPLDIEQDIESPVFLEGEWDNPTFRLEGPDFPLHLAEGLPIDLRDITLTGDLSPDLRELAGLAVVGTLDTRTLGLFASAELCSVLSLTGDCIPCPDGELACVVTEFRDWTAQRIDD